MYLFYIVFFLVASQPITTVLLILLALTLASLLNILVHESTVLPEHEPPLFLKEVSWHYEPPTLCVYVYNPTGRVFTFDPRLYIKDDVIVSYSESSTTTIGPYDMKRLCFYVNVPEKKLYEVVLATPTPIREYIELEPYIPDTTPPTIVFTPSSMCGSVLTDNNTLYIDAIDENGVMTLSYTVTGSENVSDSITGPSNVLSLSFTPSCTSSCSYTVTAEANDVKGNSSTSSCSFSVVLPSDLVVTNISNVVKLSDTYRFAVELNTTYVCLLDVDTNAVIRNIQCWQYAISPRLTRLHIIENNLYVMVNDANKYNYLFTPYGEWKVDGMTTAIVSIGMRKLEKIGNLLIVPTNRSGYDAVIMAIDLSQGKVVWTKAETGGSEGAFVAYYFPELNKLYIGGAMYGGDSYYAELDPLTGEGNHYTLTSFSWRATEGFSLVNNRLYAFLGSTYGSYICDITQGSSPLCKGLQTTSGWRSHPYALVSVGKGYSISVDFVNSTAKRSSYPATRTALYPTSDGNAFYFAYVDTNGSIVVTSFTPSSPAGCNGTLSTYTINNVSVTRFSLTNIIDLNLTLVPTTVLQPTSLQPIPSISVC